MDELNEKTAVITGAASGIGLAMAHRFGAAGMNLVLADVEPTPLAAAVADLEGAGYPVVSAEVDVRSLESIQALEARARDQFGKVHLLCNNAGVGSGGPVAGIDDLERWRWTIDVDLWGVIYGCKVFLPAMVEHGEPAHIVNTASMAGLNAAPLMGAYSVAKYGVVALSETMAKEMLIFSPSVGVSVLCPAFVATAIAESERNLPDDVPPPPDSGDAAGLDFGVKEMVAAGIPAEDVAEAVHSAVVNNEFWILTHPETHDWITHRAREIVGGVNPSLQGLP